MKVAAFLIAFANWIGLFLTLMKVVVDKTGFVTDAGLYSTVGALVVILFVGGLAGFMVVYPMSIAAAAAKEEKK